jgi:ribonuclease T2
MRRWVAYALMLFSLTLAAGSAFAQQPGEPGKFDFYLLNLSWSPEFCATHGGNPQCAAHPGFIVHGLWANNNDGSYPYRCGSTAGPANPAAYADITPDASLVQHEWEMHGTCSGFAPDVFFAMERKAFHTVTIPPAFEKLDHEIMLAPDEILAQFAKANPDFPSGSVLLSCGNNRLTAIEVCMTKQLQPMACPAVIRSCHANAVKVTPQVAK